MFETLLALATVLFLTSDTLAQNEAGLSSNLNGCTFDGCPKLVCNVEEFMGVLAQLKNQVQDQQASCSMHSVGCYLLNIDNLLDNEVNQLVSSDSRTYVNCGHECAMLPFCPEQPGSGCCPILSTKTIIRQTKVEGEQDLLRVLTGNRKYLDSELNFESLNEAEMAENLLIYLSSVHRMQQDGADLMSDPESIDLVIKQLFYNKVVRDICLDSVHLLYERITSTVTLLFNSDMDLIRPIMRNYNLCKQINSKKHLRKAFVEAYLCRYARMATVSAIKEDGSLRVRINSLEPLDKLKGILSGSCED